MGGVRFLTAAEVMERYQCSRRQLYRLITYERLPVLRLGDGPKAGRRFDPRALERWERRNTEGAA